MVTLILWHSRQNAVAISHYTGESCDIVPVTSVAPPIKPVTPIPGNPQYTPTP